MQFKTKKKSIKILTDFGLFDPPRVKISTLAPLCFMFYYQIEFVFNLKKMKFPKKTVSPFWAWPLRTLGFAPKDLD